ncbi:unnamed protein product, partial [Meganyctiphanes norvegica]
SFVLEKMCAFRVIPCDIFHSLRRVNLLCTVTGHFSNRQMHEIHKWRNISKLLETRHLSKKNGFQICGQQQQFRHLSESNISSSSDVASGFPALLTGDNIQAFINSIDNVVTDCDGILWRGGVAIPGSADMIQRFHDMGKKVFYVTNDCNISQEDLHAKAKRLGFPGEKECFMSPTIGLAEYLKQCNFQKKVYVLGMDGIVQDLHHHGIEYCQITPEPTPEHFSPYELMTSLELDPEVGAVVVGFDHHISMSKLAKATSYVYGDNSCLFLSLAVDENNAEMKNPIIIPGTGALAKCIELASGREAVVIGKPSTTMFDLLNHEHDLDPTRTLMMGDRCNTDVLFGKNCGLHTLLVLSGHAKMELLQQYASSSDPHKRRHLPHYYLPCLGDMLTLLKT